MRQIEFKSLPKNALTSYVYEKGWRTYGEHSTAQIKALRKVPQDKNVSGYEWIGDPVAMKVYLVPAPKFSYGS